MAAAIGGFVFAVSDSLIAIDMFYSKIPHAKVLIMVTYYIAQFGITLSILDLTTESAIRHKATKKTDKDVMSAPTNFKVTAVEGGVRQRGSGSNSN
jgi:YhhN family